LITLNESQKLRHLIIIKDRQGRRAIPLEKASYSLGRADNNSIVLYGPCISRQHATILRLSNPDRELTRFRVIDGSLNGTRSTNGLFINGSQFFARDLQHRDVIEIGDEVTIQYYVLSNLSDADFQKFCQVDNFAKDLSSPIYKYDTTKIERDFSLDSNEIVIARLASFPELTPNPILEIDLAGNITYLNPTANLQFPQLANLGSEHPIITQLPTLVKEYNVKYFVREIEFDNRILEQGIHYLEDSELIRIFIADITQRKQLEQQRIQEYNLLQKLLTISQENFESKLTKLLEVGCDYFQLDIGVICQIEANILTILQVYSQSNSSEIFQPGKVFDLNESFTDDFLTYFRQTINQIQSDNEAVSAESNLQYKNSELQQDDRGSEYFSQSGYLGISLVFENKVLGILSFFKSNNLEKNYTATELHYLKLISQWLGKEIANHQTQIILQQQIQQAKLLKQITQTIYYGFNTVDILHNIAQQIGQALNISRCSIHYYKEKPHISIPCVAEYLRENQISMLNVEIPLMNNPYIQKILSQDSAVISNLNCDLTNEKTSLTFCQQYAIDSILTVRTSHQGKINGVIVIYREQNLVSHQNTSNWTEIEIDSIELIAQKIGILIAQSQLSEQETLQRILLNKRNQELKSIKELLSKTIAKKNQFLNNAFDYIQILHNKIFQDLQLLKSQSLDLKQLQQLQSICYNCENLINLTQNIQELTNLESDKSILNQQSLKLESCLKEVVRQILAQSVNQKYQISYYLDPHIPQIIIQDLSKLQQLLRDLITKIINFDAEVKSLEIFVTAFLIDSEKNYYEILFTIYNKDLILTREQQKTLFIPFSYKNNFSSETYDYVGLKFAICQQLITMMGGKLWIVSRGKVTGNYPSYWQLDRNINSPENSGLTLHFTILAQSMPMVEV
jgi:pSer/pThr/pTyr-binding forkhead associated (FHA) protein/signal transduction histidine kinase